MYRKFIGIVLILCALTVIASPARPAQAQAGTVWDLIAEVNALRAGYGLAPLEVDPYLMASAQGHSDYQASINTVTHTGPDGSRPRDRAAAYGYGGGATIFISENIAGGMNLSVQTAVYEFWADEVHVNTMINSQYRHIGGGVAFNGDRVFYTIDVGVIAGQPGAGTGGTPGAPSGGATANPSQYIFGIQTVTPHPDGSIVHVVGQGQSLWSISEAYKITIEQLKALNGLVGQPLIWVGDKLVVRPSFTPTVSPTVTDTPVPPTITVTPSRTPLPPTPTLSPTPSSTPTRAPLLPDITRGGSRRSIGVAIMGVSILGLALILAGAIRKK
jgi:hypothetical protein